MLAPRTHPEPTPPSVPKTVYRVDYPGSQTTFSPTTGFHARNQTTVVSTPSQLTRYALPHLHWQTNISSPFISVFADRAHAERWARAISASNPARTGTSSSESSGGSQGNGNGAAGVDSGLVYVVEIDTGELARGPIFRAADLLKGVRLEPEEEGRHWSEYLVLYRIPAGALREEVLVAGGGTGTWEGLGLF